MLIVDKGESAFSYRLQIEAAYAWATVPLPYRAYGRWDSCADAPVRSMVKFIKFGNHTSRVDWQSYTPLQIYWAWNVAKGVPYVSKSFAQPLTETEAQSIPYELPAGKTWTDILAEAEDLLPEWTDATFDIGLLHWLHVEASSLGDVDTRRESRICMVHGETLAAYTFGPCEEQLLHPVLEIYLRVYLFVEKKFGKLERHQVLHLGNAIIDCVDYLGSQGISVVNIDLEEFWPGELLSLEVQVVQTYALDPLARVARELDGLELENVRRVYIVRMERGLSLADKATTTSYTGFKDHFGTGSGFDTLYAYPTSFQGAAFSMFPYINLFCGRMVVKYHGYSQTSYRPLYAIHDTHAQAVMANSVPIFTKGYDETDKEVLIPPQRLTRRTLK